MARAGGWLIRRGAPLWSALSWIALALALLPGGPLLGAEGPGSRASELASTGQLSPDSRPELVLPYRMNSVDERSPVEELVPATTPPRLTVQLRGGMLWPESDVIQLIYQTKLIEFGVGGGYFVLPDVLVSLGGGYVHRTGKAVGRNSHVVSGEDADLYLFPIELGASWRLSRLSFWTLTPFLNAGLDYTIYREVSLDSSVTGGKWGAHARVGLGWRIDSGASRGWTSDANRGLRGTWLTLEGGYASARNFGTTGNDFSGYQVLGGVNLDF